jgi:branched-chain amino acid transport system substrate-binding protein
MPRMSVRVALMVSCLAIVLAVLGAAASTSAGAGKPIIIGVASAQTGFFSFYDKPIATAIKLAAAEFNAKGGINGRPIKVVVSDTKSDVNLSAQAATEVLGKGANFVVTMCDFDLGAPAARVAQKKGVLSLSCAGSPLFGPAAIGPLAFSVSEGTSTQGAVAAEFAKQKGWKTVYLMQEVTTQYSKDWCASLVTRFKQLGGRVVGKDSFQLNDQTVKPQVTRLRASGAKYDFIALCGFPPIGATAIKQIRAAGINAPIIGTAGFDGPFWVGAVPNVSNVYATATTSLFGDDPNAKANAVVKLFKAKTGKAPDTSYLTYGYSMVELIKQAVQATKSTDGSKIANWLTSGVTLNLAIGPTRYPYKKCHDSFGRSMLIVQYQKGKGSTLEQITPKQVPIPGYCK